MLFKNICLLKFLGITFRVQETPARHISKLGNLIAF